MKIEITDIYDVCVYESKNLKTPRILMSTIHGAKGGEREKVLVLLDLTAAAIKQGDEDPDDLHRLFYTAFTRAKPAATSHIFIFFSASKFANLLCSSVR